MTESIRGAIRRLRTVHESFGRSLVKALTYRVFMIIISVSVAFVFTQNVGQALGIGLVTNMFKTFTYFGYERLWARTDWGIDGSDDETVDEIESQGSENEVTLGSLVEEVKRHPDSPKAGAVVTFTGRVRRRDFDDDVETTYLEFDKYDGVAEARVEEIRSDLKEREGVYEVLLHHKEGVVGAENDVVYVVVLAGHRKEAFEAVRDGIDRLKQEVPIFKKEVTEEGGYWVHEVEHGDGEVTRTEDFVPADTVNLKTD